MKLINSQDAIEDRFFFEGPMGSGPRRVYRLYVDKDNKKVQQFVWDEEADQWADTPNIIRAIIGANSDFSETTYEEARNKFPQITKQIPEEG